MQSKVQSRNAEFRGVVTFPYDSSTGGGRRGILNAPPGAESPLGAHRRGFGNHFDLHVRGEIRGDTH